MSNLHRALNKRRMAVGAARGSPGGKIQVRGVRSTCLPSSPQDPSLEGGRALRHRESRESGVNPVTSPRTRRRNRPDTTPGVSSSTISLAGLIPTIRARDVPRRRSPTTARGLLGPLRYSRPSYGAPTGSYVSRAGHAIRRESGYPTL